MTPIAMLYLLSLVLSLTSLGVSTVINRLAGTRPFMAHWNQGMLMATAVLGSILFQSIQKETGLILTNLLSTGFALLVWRFHWAFQGRKPHWPGAWLIAGGFMAFVLISLGVPALDESRPMVATFLTALVLIRLASTVLAGYRRSDSPWLLACGIITGVSSLLWLLRLILLFTVLGTRTSGMLVDTDANLLLGLALPFQLTFSTFCMSFHLLALAFRENQTIRSRYLYTQDLSSGQELHRLLIDGLTPALARARSTTGLPQEPLDPALAPSDPGGQAGGLKEAWAILEEHRLLTQTRRTRIQSKALFGVLNRLLKVDHLHNPPVLDCRTSITSLEAGWQDLFNLCWFIIRTSPVMDGQTKTISLSLQELAFPKTVELCIVEDRPCLLPEGVSNLAIQGEEAMGEDHFAESGPRLLHILGLCQKLGCSGYRVSRTPRDGTQFLFDLPG